MRHWGDRLAVFIIHKFSFTSPSLPHFWCPQKLNRREFASLFGIILLNRRRNSILATKSSIWGKFWRKGDFTKLSFEGENWMDGRVKESGGICK
jgi:hypothetical protein